MKEMKDSGVEWIGKIPAGWSVSRVKNNFYIISGSGFKPDLQGETFGDYPVCKASDISLAGKKLYRAANFISYQIAQQEHFSIIPKNSILLPKIGEALKKNSRTICQIDCCVDNNCQALVPRNIDTYYAYYLLTCIDMTIFDNHGTIPSINNRELLSFYIPLPPLAEQATIALYLDDKCAEIDAIISKHELIIAKLKEYRASLITETVTRGLNPSVKMKYVAMVNPVCKVPDISLNDSVTFVPMECVRNNKRLSGTASLQQNNSSYSTFNEGDIALAKVTPCFQNGNICVMENLVNGFAFGSSELFNIRPIHINTRFLLYYLMTSEFISGGIASMTGVAGLQRVSQNYLRNVRLPYPTLAEQTTIASYLDDKCARIDDNIAKRELIIRKLTDYKKSLIYEVVTGKKEI